MKYKTVNNTKGEPEYVLVPVKKWQVLTGKPAAEPAGPYKSKKEIIEDIREALEEVKLHREGKIKLTSARDFLNELDFPYGSI